MIFFRTYSFFSNIIRGLLFLVLGIVGILLLILVGLQTKQGQLYLGYYLERGLSDAENKVTLVGIEGVFPTDITVKQIIWRNEKNEEKLNIQDARLHWSPLGLLKGMAVIWQISAEKVIFTQIPEKVAAPENEPPIDIVAKLRLASMLRVHDFKIKQLILNVNNSQFAYRLYGGINAYNDKEEILTTLHLESTEGPASNGMLSLGLNPQSLMLSVHGYVNETVGGGLAAALNLPTKDTISLTVHGEAPLRDWQGKFVLSLSAAPLISGGIAVKSGQEVPFIGVEAIITPLEDALPMGLRAYFPSKDPLHLQLGLLLEKGGNVTIPSLTLANSTQQLQFSGKFIQQRLAGVLSGDITLPSSMPEVLGKHSNFTLHMEKTPDTLHMKDINIGIAEGNVTGDAIFNIGTKELQTAVSYTKKQQDNSAASITVTANLTGTLDDLILTATMACKNLQSGAIILPSLSGTLTARHLTTAAEGEATLSFNDGKQDYHLQSNFISKPDTIDISKLELKAPNTAFKGSVRFYKASKLVEAVLEGNIGDISSLHALTKQNIKGSAQLKLQLTPKGKMQDASLLLTADNVQNASPRPLTIRHMDIMFRVSDLWAEKRGELILNVSELSSADFQGKSIKFEAGGTAEKITFSSKGEGVFKTPFDFASKGTMTNKGENTNIVLQELSGRFYKRSFALLNPASLKISPDKVRLEKTGLRYAKGTVQLTGDYDTQAVNIALQLIEFPLSALPVSSARYVNGTANGKLLVVGKPASPIATLSLTVTQFAYNDTSHTVNSPSFSLKTEGVLKEGRCTINTLLSSGENKELDAHIMLPVTFSVQPFRFVVPPDGTMQGTINAGLNADTIANILLLDNQKLGGKIEGKFLLSGTVSQPSFSGDATIKQGIYEHSLLGVVLHNIDVALKASPTGVKIINATATDGNGGRLSATGGMDNSAVSSPVAVTILLKKFYLLHGDNLDIRANGTAKLSGNMHALNLTGTLAVDKANLHIPDRIAPSIAKLNVVEINPPEYRRKRSVRLNNSETPLPLTFDLAINLPNRIFLRGRGLDAELSGNLNVTGNAASPDVTGVLHVIRGRYQFIGQNFTLTPSSTATFRGAIPPSPFLDITAEAPAADVTAQVKFVGTLSAPKLTVTSTPPLPMEEVLSRLLFGSNLKTISPSQALRLVSVTRELLGEGGEVNFLDRTRSFLKLDDLEIKQTDQGGSAFGVGKYIRKGIYVGAQKNLGTDGGKANVEIELTPHISLESEVGSTIKNSADPTSQSGTQSGVGINWKYDY